MKLLPFGSVAVLLWSSFSSLSAADWFLTIGGGYAPSGNQVSLERNIVFYQRVLRHAGHEASPHTLLFADGDKPGRDVQFEAGLDSVPKANRYMARLFGSENYLDLAYRDHQLEQVAGESSEANIERWFKDTGSKLKPGDRVILYAAAHGGRSTDKENAYDTKLYLWNNQALQARRLADLIHGLPGDVSVVLIMAQCYSGGFSHVIFNEANAGKGDQPRPVCGFYATIHTRTAAGCTPEINEENYQEFSSHFWAAMLGESRTGKAVESCDFDGDGQVSFEEAHAHTILSAETIDIPLKTSEAFLVARSRFQDKDNLFFMPRNEPYSKVISTARAADRAVLEKLSERLGLEGEDRHSAATKAAAGIEKKRKELQDEGKKKKGPVNQAKNAIRDQLRSRWPELANVLTVQSTNLLTDEANAFVEAVEAHPRFDEWGKLEAELEKIEDERFLLEKQWILHQRFIRTLEHVILAANLELSDDGGAKKRLEEILKAESGTL